MQLTKLSQLYPYINTTDHFICEYINEGLQNRTELTELTATIKPDDENTNYFIRIGKPAYTVADFLSDDYRHGRYAAKIREKLQPFFPNISLKIVQRQGGDKWCRINIHSIFGIKLPKGSGIHSECDCPLIKVGDERIIIIPNVIVNIGYIHYSL